MGGVERVELVQHQLRGGGRQEEVQAPHQGGGDQVLQWGGLGDCQLPGVQLPKIPINR